MSQDALGFGAVKAKRSVYALVQDMATAVQIVKAGAGLHVGVRNFDRSEKLVEEALGNRPFLVILDFEKCEAEAFRTLNEMHKNADLKGIPKVGFVTQGKVLVKPEAEKSGCFRVYMKTEFGRELPDLIARYAV